MINGAEVIQTTESAERHKASLREAAGQVRVYDANLQAHIDLLETAITESSDPSEKERGRAAIRRLRSGMEGTLKK